MLIEFLLSNFEILIFFSIVLVIVGFLILFFMQNIKDQLNTIVKLFNKVFPEREGPKPFGAKYVNNELINKSVEISLMMVK